ncbi:hypothetical protein FRB94_005413 [Tulasnella sp. JGI-2019a]|nr:hypothetical protein FRB94_005413 [Tulasnella sp. JGI-2019a]
MAWADQSSYCTSTRYTSNIGDTLSFSFTGVAVYVIGTVDCDWSGLIAIALDGAKPIIFDRRSCPNVAGQSLCEYPWFTSTNLANQTHTVTLNLTGPNPKSAPSGHIIADLRYITYTTLELETASSSSSSIIASTSASASYPTNTVPVASSSKSSSTGPIVGGVVGGILVLLLIALFFFCRNKKRNQRERADLLGDGVGRPPGWGDTTAPIDPGTTAMYEPVPVTFPPAAAAAVIPGVPSNNTSKVDLMGGQRVWTPYSDSAPPTSTVATAPGTSSAPSSSAGDFNPYAPQQLYNQNILDASVAAVQGQRESKGGRSGGTGASPASNASASGTAGTDGTTHDDLVHRIATTVAAMMMRGEGGENVHSPPPQYQR